MVVELLSVKYRILRSSYIFLSFISDNTSVLMVTSEECKTINSCFQQRRKKNYFRVKKETIIHNRSPLSQTAFLDPNPSQEEGSHPIPFLCSLPTQCVQRKHNCKKYLGDLQSRKPTKRVRVWDRRDG